MLEEVKGGAVEGTMLKREGAVGEGVQMLKREQVCVCGGEGGGQGVGGGWGVQAVNRRGMKVGAGLRMCRVGVREESMHAVVQR